VPTTDTLDDAIRSLIAELTEASPPAPLLGELDGIEVHPRRPASAHRSRRRSRPRLLAVIGGFGVVCLAALLLVLFLPDTGQRIPAAEAAQLHLIATNAADQPVQHLGRNQWIMARETISYLDSETRVSSTPVVGAEATVSATLDQWSNRFGESCSSTTTGPTSFATPANRSAWLSLGLLESPIDQPMKSCGDIIGANIENGASYVINVAHLPTNPSTLANKLETGTTGILQIDDAGSTADPSRGLQRAGLLLLGPTVGSSPSLTSATYTALALMPGIHKLGRVTSHSGAVGLGFSAESPEGPRTIVVDPDTGRVLEVENIPISSVIGTLGIHSPFIGPNSASQSLSGHLTIKWIDVTRAQSIIDTDQLPAGLDPTLPPNVVITAVAKPHVPYNPLAALQQQLDARFGAPRGGYSYHEAPGGAVMSFSFTRSDTHVDEFAQALRASNLIASVTVDEGDN
jgi:hypothetical protein